MRFEPLVTWAPRKSSSVVWKVSAGREPLTPAWRDSSAPSHSKSFLASARKAQSAPHASCTACACFPRRKARTARPTSFVLSRHIRRGTRAPSFFCRCSASCMAWRGTHPYRMAPGITANDRRSAYVRNSPWHIDAVSLAAEAKCARLERVESGLSPSESSSQKHSRRRVRAGGSTPMPPGGWRATTMSSLTGRDVAAASAMAAPEECPRNMMRSWRQSTCTSMASSALLTRSPRDASHASPPAVYAAATAEFALSSSNSGTRMVSSALKPDARASLE
mmetsp:Transcript_621/g.1782  ORF Transcript_621/g.1782 Transcript_621/m.1782 type:complete len:278 (+) Transcript_621:911-1744(+)